MALALALQTMTLLINNMTLVHDKLLANLHLENLHQDSFQPTEEKNINSTKKTTSNRQPPDKISQEVLCSIRYEVEDGGLGGGGWRGGGTGTPDFN